MKSSYFIIVSPQGRENIYQTVLISNKTSGRYDNETISTSDNPRNPDIHVSSRTGME